MFTMNLNQIVKSIALALPFVMASQANAWHYDDVYRTAHEMADASEHVHELAEYEWNHGDVYQERALADLHELAHAAEHLHEQIELNPRESRHTFHDFLHVEDAYQRASYSVRYARFSNHVIQDWFRVEDAYYFLRNEYLSDDHNDDPHHPWERP